MYRPRQIYWHCVATISWRVTYWPPRDGQASSVQQGWVWGRVGKTRQATLGPASNRVENEGKKWWKSVGVLMEEGKWEEVASWTLDAVTPSHRVSLKSGVFCCAQSQPRWATRANSPDSKSRVTGVTQLHGTHTRPSMGVVGGEWAWTAVAEASMGINPLHPLVDTFTLILTSHQGLTSKSSLIFLKNICNFDQVSMLLYLFLETITYYDGLNKIVYFQKKFFKGSSTKFFFA